MSAHRPVCRRAPSRGREHPICSCFLTPGIRECPLNKRQKLVTTQHPRVPIVIGEETRQAVPSLAMLELDLIAVVGKQEAVRIYTLCGDAATAQSAEFQALAECHAAMLARYRAQDWAGAGRALARCREPGAMFLLRYDLYAERIAFYAANPPRPDWDGVFVALTK